MENTARVISSKINVSNSICKLNPLEEVVFLHLIVSSNDEGVFYSSPDVVRAYLFPRRNFTTEEIKECLDKLENEKMITRYTVDGSEYLRLASWAKYQNGTPESNKMPLPPGCEAPVQKKPRKSSGRKNAKNTEPAEKKPEALSDGKKEKGATKDETKSEDKDGDPDKSGIDLTATGDMESQSDTKHQDSPSLKEEPVKAVEQQTIITEHNGEEYTVIETEDEDSDSFQEMPAIGKGMKTESKTTIKDIAGALTDVLGMGEQQDKPLQDGRPDTDTGNNVNDVKPENEDTAVNNPLLNGDSDAGDTSVDTEKPELKKSPAKRKTSGKRKAAEPKEEDNSPVFMSLPVTGEENGHYDVTENEISMYQKYYPGVDVKQQIRNMAAWSFSNPEKVKTRRYIRRFINSWLAKEQSRAKTGTNYKREDKSFGQSAPLEAGQYTISENGWG